MVNRRLTIKKICYCVITSIRSLLPRKNLSLLTQKSHKTKTYSRLLVGLFTKLAGDASVAHKLLNQLASFVLCKYRDLLQELFGVFVMQTQKATSSFHHCLVESCVITYAILQGLNYYVYVCYILQMSKIIYFIRP